MKVKVYVNRRAVPDPNDTLSEIITDQCANHLRRPKAEIEVSVVDAPRVAFADILVVLPSDFDSGESMRGWIRFGIDAALAPAMKDGTVAVTQIDIFESEHVA